jgi:antitoxin component of MazEF toxin-antitoxin module
MEQPMRSTLMEGMAVSQDHDGEETKALGIARTISKDEIAELATGPLDCQDRHAACGYEVAPSTLALERGQMLCGVLDGYGPSEYDGTPTLTIRRLAGSMWIIVPLEVAQQCERRIETEVVVRRRHDGSYSVEPRRHGMTDSRITRRQVIADGRAQRVELERALRRDDARTYGRRSPPCRCSTRRASRRHVGSRRLATKRASADPDGEPPRHTRTPTIGGARPSSGIAPPRRGASTCREVVALVHEVCR